MDRGEHSFRPSLSADLIRLRTSLGGNIKQLDSEMRLAYSGYLPVFHGLAQNGVDAGLISGALLSQPGDDIGVKAQGKAFLGLVFGWAAAAASVH